MTGVGGRTRPALRDRLAGHSVVVTGAGTAGDGVGNGQAVARLLAAQGAAVLCVDLHGDRAERVAQAIRDAGGTAAAHAGDVRDPRAASAMVAAAVDRFGTLTGLVCTVGVGGPSSVLAPPDPDPWADVLDVNVTGALHCIRAAAPALVAAGGGSVVTVGSTAGLRHYQPGALAYATSKAALSGLTLSVAGELGPHRVRANTVVIGQVWSPMVEAAAARQPDPDGYRDRRRRSGLIPDEGTPEDVADAVAFLVSDESRWITGQSLVVDGGATLTMR